MAEMISLGYAIGLLALLQIKHMLADFYLQTPIMLVNRGKLIHPGRALHCVVHAGLSVPCLAVMGVPMAAVATIAVAEWVVHYLVDLGKGRWSDMKQQGPTDAGYWRAFGFDQMVHQMTYLIMVWAAVALS